MGGGGKYQKWEILHIFFVETFPNDWKVIDYFSKEMIFEVLVSDWATDECPDTLGMKLFSLTHDEKI